MTVRNLDKMFSPRSVAVIGASEGPMRVGTVVLHNLIEGGFNGELWPVNPKYCMLQKRRCFPSTAALPAAPDRAVIRTPPAVVPALITALGEIGRRPAVRA